MAKDNRGPLITKKHLARVERERLQTRIILTISGILIAIVVILIGWGVVKTYIIEPRQTIVAVDGTQVTSHQFKVLASFNRGQLVEQYYQYYQFMQYLGGDATTESSFIQTLAQINYQLEPEYLGEFTIDSLIEDILVRKEAASRGITVSEAEIDKALEEYLGYYPEGTPTPSPTEEIKPTSTLSPIQMTLVPATPTPVITETASIPATETPIIGTPATAPDTNPTATTEIMPTATEYTEKLYNQNADSYLEYTNISKNDLRWIFESQLFRQKLIEEITADVPVESDQIWVRQIVVADEESAKQVIDRFNAGEDFSALASELSIDEASKSNGGDIGWIGLGTLDTQVEKIAFNLSIGQISEPVQTTSGWYIVQVLGHEVRPVPDTDYQQLLDSTYQNWLTNARAAAQVDINEIWLERVPTEPSIPPNLQLTQ